MTTTTKRIRIHLPGATSYRMIAIQKGSTVADALRAMDMEADHHRVEHELSGEVLEANDNLYELLEENESLAVTPHFDAGGSAGR